MGWAVQLRFDLAQHKRDELLLRNLINFLSCGKINKEGECFRFIVTKWSDVENKIIPFFRKYPIIGVKSKHFLDFCKVAELMKTKAYLTKEGLEQIRKIKAGMNTGREY